MAESRLISISWRLFPLVSITFFCTKITATTQKKPKIAFRSTEPSCSSILRNSSPTKKFITCCCVKLIIVSTLNPFPKKKSIDKKPYPVNSKTNSQCCCPKTTRAYLRQENTWNRTSSSCKRQHKPAYFHRLSFTKIPTPLSTII